MALELQTVYIIFYTLLGLNVAVLLLILWYRKYKSNLARKAEGVRAFIISDLKYLSDEDAMLGNDPNMKNAKLFEQQYIQFIQHSQDDLIERKATLFLEHSNRMWKHARRLKGFQAHMRIRAAVALGFYYSEDAVKLLEESLEREKEYYVKLYIVNALVQLGEDSSIPIIVNTLVMSPEWFRQKVGTLLCSLGEKMYKHVPEIIESKDPFVQEFLITFAKSYPSNDLLQFLKVQSEGYNISNAVKAVDALSENYHYMLSESDYLEHSKPEIRNTAITSLSRVTTKSNIDKLLDLLTRTDTEKYIVQAISQIIWKKPELVDYVVDRFHDTNDFLLRRNLTEVLSNRIEYFVQKTISREKKYIKILLREVLLIGKTSQIIGFLNKNNNEAIEAELLKVIGKIIYGKKDVLDIESPVVVTFFDKKAPWDIVDDIIERVRERIDLSYLNNVAKSEADLNNKLKDEILSILHDGKENNDYVAVSSIVLKAMLKLEFRTYLKDEILAKLNLDKYKPVKKRKVEEVEKDKMKFLQILLGSMVVLFPLIYILRHGMIFASANWVDLFKLYVIDFNYILVYYSTSINFIYILLLVLSIFGVAKQKIFWEVKQKSFLFKKKMLPSISIIAPAYGEQETIIESVNSLLNLEYPNYELIVVNDGSPDNTLNVLIDYFSLEKIDVVVDEQLNTQPIRGIYANKSIAKLTVVDKTNGGKADALNVGINVAKNDFFCGIDSDSLLEPDALLKLASHTLDSDNESVAMGGNVFPINGCVVHKGKLEQKRIPKHPLARLQTIEYLRAFMAGRIGWSYINSLLIISGAFGLFSRKRIIEIGGYLTSSGKYRKDTVGEDMELVVRISRHMREKDINYAVHYAYNANCWTEVPEDMNILHNQRDRWQRGLIDITNFHKKILFNRKYGRMGTVAMPYFFIFEMVGPLIEVKGYVMVILAAFLGMLNQHVALMLFTSSIVMGMLISILSIFISELEGKQFSFKGLLILMAYAIGENFGPRQYFSYWRAKGFFSAMKKPKGWGTMVRKVKHTILILSDTEPNTQELKRLVEKKEMVALVAKDAKDAIQLLTKENVHYAIYDSDDFENGVYIREQLNSMESKKHIPLLVADSKFIVPESEEKDELLVVTDEPFENLEEIVEYVSQQVAETNK